jgi:MFS family permease
LPLLALSLICPLRSIAPTAQRRIAFYKVLKAVWLPGLGLAMSSIGFGIITTFVTLLFAARSWSNASLAFTAFGAAFIAARLVFGHLPDRLGGAKVALVCVLIEALGQVLIWRATEANLALAGAALTGFGYSLAFPGFGVEAVRRAPAQSRGAAMGAYVAFLDIALAIAAPAAGAIATTWGVSAVYLAGGIVVAAASLVAVLLLGNRRAPTLP